MTNGYGDSRLRYNCQNHQLPPQQPATQSMTPRSQNTHSKSQLPARKIHRLIEYLRNVGLDPNTIASRAGVDLVKVLNATANDTIPSIYYALIYNEMVVDLQNSGKHPPWAAGLGSDNFRMMCYSLISCKTLGDALHRAQKYNQLVRPLYGQQVSLHNNDAKNATIEYQVDDAFIRRSISPANWSSEECSSVARSSGLEMWLGLCGWLIGRKIEPTHASIAGAVISTAYQQRIRAIFQCLVEFEAATTSFSLPAEMLELRIVHNTQSLEEFLDTGPFQLWSTDDKLVSTTAAIKSLLGNDFSNGIPSFEDMAANMNMSTSTLRRHLLAEGSSYQTIKDERRRDIAIELLCLSTKKISDISDQVGFSDTSSFVRSFKAWTDLTPKAYRVKSLD